MAEMEGVVAAMIEPIPYTPNTLIKPSRCLSGSYGTSAWTGLESILADLLDTFHVGRGLALEFGSEHGYSLVALSNFFDRVVGVDPFPQLTSTEPIEPMENRCRRNVAPYPNITVITAPWQIYTQEFDRTEKIAMNFDPERYAGSLAIDLIHIDGEHDYYHTFGSGDWACAHAPVVIFHDANNAFVDVPRAISDLCEKYGRKWYLYPKHEGLGILVDAAHEP